MSRNEKQPLLSNQSKSDDVIANLEKVYSEISNFDKSIKELNSQRDTTTFRSTLHTKKVQITELLKTISNQVKQFHQNKQIPKFQQEKILKQFKDATDLFDKLVTQCNQKEASSEPIQDISSPYGSLQLNQSRNSNMIIGEQQTLEIEQEDEIYNRIIEERNKQTKDLLIDIQQLSEISRDINSLVVEQGEQLTIADTNVTQADENVEVATEELGKAMEYKSSYRKKLFILVICIIITLFALVIFLGIYFGVIKGKSEKKHPHTE